MIDLLKPKRPTTVLGLSFDGNRLEAVVLRRTNGSFQALQSVSVQLALSPLSGDPELVGREIRNHLDQAGIRERRCAVCLPLNWVLTVQTQLPEMEEADVESFLQIEAERGFPSGHDNLQITHSRVSATSGEKFATLLGIPRNHISILERALKAAQLKPLTFSLGITALASSGKDTGGALTLALAAHGIDLQVGAGGGIAALRSLDGAVEMDGAQRRIDADFVARELRITLGQLPPALAREVTTARVFGRGDIARQFVSDIAPRAQAMGLRVELMDRAADASFGQPPAAPEITLSPALALAANYLNGSKGAPEFLPPKVKPWQQFLTRKNSSKQLVWVASAAGGVVVCVILAFGYQQWQISRLDSRWRAISPRVARLNDDIDQIKKYRPWFDSSFRTMRILKAVTQAFPEEGYLATAKNVEIRDVGAVTCSGVARDNQAYLSLFEKLRGLPEVADLKTEMVRGQSPVQFTLNFNWQEGGQASGH